MDLKIIPIIILISPSPLPPLFWNYKLNLGTNSSFPSINSCRYLRKRKKKKKSQKIVYGFLMNWSEPYRNCSAVSPHGKNMTLKEALYIRVFCNVLPGFKMSWNNIKKKTLLTWFWTSFTDVMTKSYLFILSLFSHTFPFTMWSPEWTSVCVFTQGRPANHAKTRPSMAAHASCETLTCRQESLFCVEREREKEKKVW